MINTIAEYNKRLNEVEIYFDSLSLLDKGTCEITCTDIVGNVTTKNIDTQLSTILKANGFLLLYNLIEATIRKSIDAVLNSIHSSSVSFAALSDKLRKIWLRQELKKMSSEKLIDIAESILNNSIICFEKECINISGNIDAQEIRNILKQLGGTEISNGRNLKTIKDKRNNLAHGEFTFSEIGGNYTVSELIQYKEETKSYLSSVLAEIQSFISNKKFLI